MRRLHFYFIELADLSACWHLFFRSDQRKLAVSIFCAQKHAFRYQSADLSRLQVYKNHNLLANHLLRAVGAADTGYDLTYLASDLHLRAEQLISFRNSFAGKDLTYLKLQFCEIIIGYSFFCFDINDIFLLSSLCSLSSFVLFYFCQNLFDIPTGKLDLRCLCYSGA